MSGSDTAHEQPLHNRTSKSNLSIIGDGWFL